MKSFMIINASKDDKDKNSAKMSMIHDVFFYFTD